ncbi:hypothetical protein [Paenibacillus agilis]|uniref:Uncharacterized protein n=1 Tax=Paenibacillus agilis TaxID=3020863 RepID=A0A559J2N2_9BACL|nr:hypothetical protein [Paenibacillus agilis]TVX94086.1 hypothetical protein FPZ44_14100 [Paenibacillus agilis]
MLKLLDKIHLGLLAASLFLKMIAALCVLFIITLFAYFLIMSPVIDKNTETIITLIKDGKVAEAEEMYHDKFSIHIKDYEDLGNCI